MTLNPKIAQVLAMIERAKLTPYHRQTPPQARAAYEKSAPLLDVLPAPLFSVEDLTVPVRDGSMIRARLYCPVAPTLAEPLPALVYYHGGGFTIGSVATHDALCRLFARDARCAVLSVAYRLAPEHRFPTAVHDAFDALMWLHAQAANFGLDAERFAVGGDSAGGTLAAVTAVLGRDAGISLALQLLLYPGTSRDQQSASHSRFAEGYLLTRDTLQWFFSHYVRAASERDDWRFAPLDGTRGEPSFTALAPAWIATAEYDPLVDEGIAYADKLRAAGNRVTLICYAGMIHEFFKMGGFVPEIRAAHAQATAALIAAFERA